MLICVFIERIKDLNLIKQKWYKTMTSLIDYENVSYSEIQNTFHKYSFVNQDNLQYLALKYFLENCETAKDFLLKVYNIVCDQEKAHKCDAMYLYRDILKYHKKGNTMYCGLDKHNHVIFRTCKEV